MSRRGFLLLGLLLCGVGLYGCQKPKEPTALETTVASDSETARREIEIETPTETSEAETAEMDSREAKEIDVEAIVNRYEGIDPTQWSDRATGVVFRLDTDEKVAVLTFDACGGSEGANGYDVAIIDYLREAEIPATLFVNADWIENHSEAFEELKADPLFTMGNHGTFHKPLSVVGKGIYGIEGTRNPREVVEEVMGNPRVTSTYFRSGTAYYDEVALNILEDLGYVAIGYDISADAGASFNVEEIRQAFGEIRPGSILLMHFNRPDGDSYEGLVLGVKEALERGYTFVNLADYLFVVAD